VFEIGGAWLIWQGLREHKGCVPGSTGHSISIRTGTRTSRSPVSPHPTCQGGVASAQASQPPGSDFSTRATAQPAGTPRTHSSAASSVVTPAYRLTSSSAVRPGVRADSPTPGLSRLLPSDGRSEEPSAPHALR
jgi:hypothetical protein